MRAVVVGLRATGASVVAALRARAWDVTVVEDRPEDAADAYPARRDAAVALGATVLECPDPDRWDALVAGADLVAPSPGVRPAHPAYDAARSHGIAVRGDVDLAFDWITAPVVAVTGTNGKSTVTTLITSMLVESGVRVQAVGNIGTPILSVVDDPVDVLVVEVSSFQLHATTAAFRPRVAVLLNVTEDHLDWHGSFEAYVEAKRRVFAHQGPDDVLVANVDDPVVARLALDAPGQVRACSADDVDVDALIGGWTSDAPFEQSNARLAAVAAAEVGATASGIGRALRTTPRLHHRREPVDHARGVQFVDDSKATNPAATLAALRGYPPGSVVLLAGGASKGCDLRVLRGAADRIRAVVAIGTTPEEIEVAFAGVTAVARAGSMPAAVRTAFRLAAPGDTVLLSPACASIDEYPSYVARGEAFITAVRDLVRESEVVRP